MNHTTPLSKSNNNSILLLGFISSILILIYTVFNIIAQKLGFRFFDYPYSELLINVAWPIATILVYWALKKIVEVKYNQTNLGILLAIIIGAKIASYIASFIFLHSGVVSFFEIYTLINSGLWLAQSIILFVFGLTLLQSKISFYRMRVPYSIVAIVAAGSGLVALIGNYFLDSALLENFLFATNIPSIALLVLNIIVLYKAFTDRSFNDTEHSSNPFV